VAKLESYLLRFSLVGSLTLVVDATEVGDDDRNRKCYDEHSAQRADSAHHLANHRTRTMSPYLQRM